MLYGTRKELNKKLKRMFGNEERIALLVWTKQDVMAQVENMTEAEADAVLELIGRAGRENIPKTACRSAPFRRCMPGLARTPRA